MKHYIFLAIVIFSASCTPIPEWSVSNPCDPAYSGPLECNPQDTGTIDLPDISLIADVGPVYGDDAEITGDTGQQDATLVQDAEIDPPDTYEEDGGDLDEEAGPDTDVDDDTGPIEVDDAGPADGLGQAIITATTEEGGKTAEAAITVQTAPGIWYDIDTGLMWENPPEGGLGTWQEADEYCSSLQLAGHANWRLPTISELRTLVHGWPATESDGECRITDECVVASCYSSECAGTTAQAGQCLWADGLAGECQEPFYSSISHNESYMLVLVYDKAMVTAYHRNNNGHFRCTRSN